MPRFASQVVLAAAAVLLGFHEATAQIMRRPAVTQPVNWVGANVGIVQGYSLADGTTGATWNFGSGLEYAGRLEHPTSRGLSFGAQASYASMPLTYSSTLCASCDAKATVRQLAGILHYGSGYTFHPVYELTVGAIGYSNFRRTDDPSIQLGSGKTDYDLKFSLGYGLGFGLSPSAKIEVIQEVGTVLHQRDGLAGSASNYPRVYVTRLGGKVAF